MASVVSHSLLLITSFLRVILIHYEMMFRHAPSHQCGSSKSIRVQEWRHNPRKYSLHPSLTNRHRSSSTFLQLVKRQSPFSFHWVFRVCSRDTSFIPPNLSEVTAVSKTQLQHFSQSSIHFRYNPHLFPNTLSPCKRVQPKINQKKKKNNPNCRNWTSDP